jgi:hypothetical protein
MKQFLLLVSGLFFYQMVLSQVSFTEVEQPKNNTPEILKNVDVQQDSILVKLLNWHIEDNERRNNMDGYRVEIFSNREMAKIQKTKIDFLSKYPEQSVHIKFIAPIFKIRIGDFRTKSEALKLFKEIEKDYRTAFIVRDKINFPLAKQTRYE